MNNIAIIGAGSAGILSACQMAAYLPRSWKVTLIHDPSIPSLGIGESTNPNFCDMLEKGADFVILDNLKELDGTYKFGTKFIKWREEEYLNHLIGGSFAIHFDTHKLQEFIVPRLKNKWGNKFEEVRGRLSSLVNKETHVEAVVNDKIYNFDFVVDCRGFPTDYTDYVLSDLPLNGCLVHNIPTPGDWGYTGHRATKNGWMFEIPLTTRQSYGYLYSDSITSKEDAKEDFSKEIGVPVSELDNIEYKFKPYYAKTIFDGRICKNGNAAIFFEPMSANSLWIYFNITTTLLHYILGRIPSVELVNDLYLNNAKAVEELLCYFYKGGSTHDTDFWKHVSKLSNQKLNNSSHLKRTLDNYYVSKHSGASVASMDFNWVFSMEVLHRVDNFLGYKYFD